MNDLDAQRHIVRMAIDDALQHGEIQSTDAQMLNYFLDTETCSLHKVSQRADRSELTLTEVKTLVLAIKLYRRRQSIIKL